KKCLSRVIICGSALCVNNIGIFMFSRAQSRLSAALFFKAVAGSLLAFSALSFAQAAEQPPIRLVVPFPPGGSTDIASRIIQPKLAELLNRDVVIENKPG